MKINIETEKQKISDEIKALDSEKSKMEELIKQREEKPVNSGFAWRDAPVHQKIEMQKVFYPEGLVYSPKTYFFEPRNARYLQQFTQMLREILDPEQFGVPDGI